MIVFHHNQEGKFIARSGHLPRRGKTKILIHEIIQSISMRVEDKDSFVLEINKSDPHLAARLVGNLQLHDETIKEVVNKLAGMITKVPSYKADLAVESLGLTRSSLATPTLMRIADTSAYWRSSLESAGNVFLALSRICDKDSLQWLYEFITSYKIITGRRPPFRYCALRALEKSDDLEAVSRFLFQQFEGGSLYKYALACQDYDVPIEKLDDYSGQNILRNEPIFNDIDEGPFIDEILALMAENAPEDIAKRLISYFLSKSSVPMPFFEWIRTKARKLLESHVPPSIIDKIFSAERKDIVHNGNRYELYIPYVRKKRTKNELFFYLCPKDIDNWMRFIGFMIGYFNKLKGYASFKIESCDDPSLRWDGYILEMAVLFHEVTEKTETGILQFSTIIDEPDYAKKVIREFFKEAIDSTYLIPISNKASLCQSIIEAAKKRGKDVEPPQSDKEDTSLTGQSLFDKLQRLKYRQYSLTSLDHTLSHHLPAGTDYNSLSERELFNLGLDLIKKSTSEIEEIIAMLIIGYAGTYDDIAAIRKNASEESSESKKIRLEDSIELVKRKYEPRS